MVEDHFLSKSSNLQCKNTESQVKVLRFNSYLGKNTEVLSAKFQRTCFAESRPLVTDMINNMNAEGGTSFECFI